MATKKVKGSYLTPFERIGGGIFFFLYLLVMPLLTEAVVVRSGYVVSFGAWIAWSMCVFGSACWW